MKVTIDIDVENLDYDVISQAVAEKIKSEVDFAKSYDINSKIDRAINNVVLNQCRSECLVDIAHHDKISPQAKRTISDMIKSAIEKEVSGEVKSLLDKFSQEDIEKIFADLLPQVMVKMMIEWTSNGFVYAQNNNEQRLINTVTETITNIIRSGL